MSVFEALILGIVQGIAEFLPISSSGHLVVLREVFQLDGEMLTFDVFVHVGSLAAILAVFWPDVWKLLKNPFCKMTGLLILGTIPAIVIGLPLRSVIEGDLFNSAVFLAAAFTLTGILLMFADSFKAGRKEERDITVFDALFVGVMQALALPPGISRSGMTITGALSRGIKRETAANFSFMLAIIAIGGVGLVESIELATGRATIENIGLTPMVVGAVASALVGYVSIKLLLKLIKACKLRYFSYYVWALAGLILLDNILVNWRF
ncbi:MAG: undecaprenyl-diphosphate phosphatase [Defluviitaleaceae bacterium]|nr:undecaprenyl-diphosphate phosphatase [Defluviitaleaceae bacterium]